MASSALKYLTNLSNYIQYAMNFLEFIIAFISPIADDAYSISSIYIYHLPQVQTKVCHVAKKAATVSIITAV